MRTSESLEHKKIKTLIRDKLKDWTGATLQEYPSTGHELDVLASTPDGITICVEIIWTSSRQNFFRDMSLIQTSDANVKLVIASPKVASNNKYQREYEKVVISQRRLNFAMHGTLIDGQRIIADPNYLDTKFKDIVLDLLKYVKIRGKIVGTRTKFEPPEPRSADRVQEQLMSNLFSVKKYPSTVFVSPTRYRRIGDVYGRLGQKIGDAAFLLKSEKIYTFSDLSKPTSPFMPIISKNEVNEEEVADWIMEEDKRNDLIYLFNLTIRKYCQNRDIYYDKEHKRFVCTLDEGRNRFFRWRPERTFASRIIAKRVKGKNGRLLYCKHYAADLRFMLIGNDLFLKIEPTMTFTSDGYHPVRLDKLPSLMSRHLSRQFNDVYLDLVRVWGKYLSKLDVVISIPAGASTIEIDSDPVVTPINIGISEERRSNN